MRAEMGFSKRHLVVLTIVVLVAAIHIFRIGSYLEGELYNIYYSYFSDLILPFLAYFLLCAEDPFFRFLRPWQVKFAIAFMLPAIAETCQYFGIPVLGSTFDLADYLMYGIGAFSAALTDTRIFPRLFDFWSLADG